MQRRKTIRDELILQMKIFAQRTELQSAKVIKPNPSRTRQDM